MTDRVVGWRAIARVVGVKQREAPELARRRRHPLPILFREATTGRGRSQPVASRAELVAWGQSELLLRRKRIRRDRGPCHDISITPALSERISAAARGQCKHRIDIVDRAINAALDAAGAP